VGGGDPDFPGSPALLGLAYYTLGKFQSARESCESQPDDWEAQECLALAYQKLGRHADAEAMFAKLKAAMGDGWAWNYAASHEAVLSQAGLPDTPAKRTGGNFLCPASATAEERREGTVV